MGNSYGSMDNEEMGRIVREQVAEQIAPFRRQIERLLETNADLEAKLNRNGQLLVKNTRLECALQKSKEQMNKIMQECRELRARNNHLEMKLQQNANQLQMEEIRREMQTKASNDELETYWDIVEQAKEDARAEMDSIVGNCVSKAKSKLRELIQQEMDSTEKKINSANEEERRESDSEPVEREICIPENKWGHRDPSLEVSDLSVNRTIGLGWGTVRAEHPFSWPSQNAKPRIAKFEVKILGNPGGLCIGVCDSNSPLNKCLIKCENSFVITDEGYVYIDGKRLRDDSGSDSGFRRGNVVGCRLDLASETDDFHGQLFFTVNGKLTGPPIDLPATVHGIDLFPAVCMGYDDNKIEAVFDRNAFRYDLR